LTRLLQLILPPDSSVAKLYSPLFIRISAKKLNLKNRHILKKRNANPSEKITKNTRKMATAMTQNMPDDPMSQREKKWEQELTLNLICPDCKEDPADLTEVPHSGDVVCNSCGLVIGDRVIDTGSEWRTFSNDDQGNDDPSRVGDGESFLLNGNQLHTSISFGAGKASNDLYRTQNKSVNDKANQNLLQAYKQIGAYCDAWNMPRNVSDTAKYLFKQVEEGKVLKGKSQDAIIAGCILIACRQHAVPRTFKEIYALTKVPKKDIGRTFKQLEKFFYSVNAKNMKDANEGNTALPVEEYTGAKATSAPELCVRYCDHLGLPWNITMISQAIAEKTLTIGTLAGRSPLSTASACIYMASFLMGQGKSAKAISDVAGVSDGTIRTAYKFLLAKKDEIIDKEWLKDGKGNMDNLPSS